MENSWVIVGLGSVALLVRVGVLLYATGTSRAKNATSAIVRQVLDLCVATLAFWAIGMAIVSFQGNGVFGIDTRLLIGMATPMEASVFAYLVVILLAGSVVPTALAERSRQMTGPVVSLAVAGLLLPVSIYWVWHGWLGRMDLIDSAGAAGLHVPVGVFAAVGAWTVGARSKKYNRDGSSNIILGHSVPLAMAGVGVMALAWPAYVVAMETTHGLVPAARVLTPINVLLSAAAAGVVACAYGHLRFHKVDPMLTCIGLLGGLVAITGAGGGVGTLAAVIIGAVAGLLVPWATVLLDLRFKLDDPTAVVAIHGVGGLWGTLAAGVFLRGDLGTRLAQVGTQALGAAAVAGLGLVLGLIVFGALRAMGRLRSKEADEFDGLDLAEHDINAYPDFQQTMIKSYHLREA